MSKKKGLLQKISIITAGVSFVLALVSGVALYLRVQDVGSDNPISASLMATTFVLMCVGTVLAVIGSADIPSFKVGGTEAD